MERHDAVKATILDLLRDRQLEPGSAISMYEIGVPLVAKGFDQHELVQALFSLEADKTIEILPANGLRLLKQLNE